MVLMNGITMSRANMDGNLTYEHLGPHQLAPPQLPMGVEDATTRCEPKRIFDGARALQWEAHGSGKASDGQWPFDLRRGDGECGLTGAARRREGR